MKKIFIGILLLATLCVPCLAEEEYNTQPIQDLEQTEVVNNIEQPEYTDKTVVDTTITLDEAENHVLKKLYEVVEFTKKIAEPISYVMFMVGAIMAIVGALGKRDGIKQGFTICIIAIIVYVLCGNAVPIIKAVSDWLIS